MVANKEPPKMSEFNKKDGVDLKYYVEKILDEKEKALTLQSAELSRRLDALNGEAGRLIAMQSTYLPREVSDTMQRAQEIKDCAQDDKIDTLESWKDKQEGKASQTAFLVTLVISLIGLALGIFSLLK